MRAAALAAGMAAMAAAAGLLYWHTSGVTTAIGEQRAITLDDGTRITLNTASRIIIRFDTQRRAVELKRGEALFDVGKDPTRPFVVLAGHEEIRALGTAFLVRDDADLSVTLMEGRISVTPAAVEGAAALAKPIALSPGERLTFPGTGSPRIDKPVLSAVTAWRGGHVELRNTPLSDAVREMNRYSSTKLVVRHAAASTTAVTGVFRAGDSRSFARAVADTFGMQVLEERGEIVLDGLPARNDK